MRDGQQSSFATRMNQEQIDRCLPFYKDANFYAMEVWGGAVPDSVMRYLDENPWTRLETIHKAVGDVSKLTALSRGRNLFGYSPYTDEIIDGFCRNSIRSGLGIMRIFDALNDVDNVKSTVKYVKQYGGIADCAVCYTVDPKYPEPGFWARLTGKSAPKPVFTDAYFLDKARQMAALGADMITIKDMSGLIPPRRVATLVRLLKKNLSVPVDFHTHCTPGYGLASVLSAIIAGVDVVDTNCWYFAEGTGAPAIELIHVFCKKLGIETGVNMEAVAKINTQLREIRKELNQSLKSATRKERKGRPSGPQDDFAPTVPIILDISEGLAASLDYDNLNDELSALRRALYFDLGVPFPGINLRVSSSLSGLTYELQVNEIPMSRGHLEQGMVLARESEDTLRMLGLDVRRGENFLPDVESLWIPAEKQALLEQAGLSCMTHSRILAYHLSLILARHASSFIGMQETKYLLDRMEERAPDLVREATRLLPVQRIAEIFQRLAQEQVSIRDLRNILEAIIEWSPKEKDTVMLTEYVRGALKRQISYMYSRGQNMLPAILMDPSVEETIRKAIRQTSAGAFLALDPDTSRRFIAAVGAAAGDYRKHVQMPVLLASMDIRRYVRRLIEGEHYRLPVVSYQELTPEISVQPMNRIRL